MKVGIVAEGPADVAVLRNILKGKLGLSRSDTFMIRPELAADETDLAAGYRPQKAEAFSNWGLVFEECRARTKIEDFLLDQIAEARCVVIHVDTAEAHLPGYGIPRPDRSAQHYCDALRALVIGKITGYLGEELSAGVRHAIAIEETDAWLLTIHDDQDTRDTSARLDPKKRLDHVLDARASKSKGRDKGGRRDEGRRNKPSPYDRADQLSHGFREAGKLDSCAARNRSLRVFVDSLDSLAEGA